MISKVILAKLSPTMEQGTIVAWRKKEGESVQVGDVLAEIETDKANMEMEALGSGVLRKILLPQGTQAPVGSLIGVIAGPEEDISLVAAESPPVSPDQPAVVSAIKPEEVAPVLTAAPHPPPTGRIRISPLARRFAAERGIALESVVGTGPGGRIIKRDVETYRVPDRSASAAETPAPSKKTFDSALSPMRRVIAQRMTESFFSAPHFYVSMEIDMDAADDLRKQLKQGRDLKITFTDLVIKACAAALREFPVVNSWWFGDKLVMHEDVHVAVAVAVPDGLLTPVIRSADRKSVLEISAEIRDLAQRARIKRLRPEEYSGSTFTVSNLGMFDVSEFTAILNPPECAILAVGAARRVAVVNEGAIRAGLRMKVTLGADHRVIDGATSARFLQRLRRLLENPASLLI